MEHIAYKVVRNKITLAFTLLRTKGYWCKRNIPVVNENMKTVSLAFDGNRLFKKYGYTYITWTGDNDNDVRSTIESVGLKTIQTVRSTVPGRYTQNLMKVSLI